MDTRVHAAYSPTRGESQEIIYYDHPDVLFEASSRSARYERDVGVLSR
jgi:hypothetical protein